VVETGGLENRCTGNRTGGSNPSPSASKSSLQRNFAVLSLEIRETCPYFTIIRTQTGLQRTDCSAAEGGTVPAFLRRTLAQSGFKEGVRRMQCDHLSETRQ
jgi:hypothetical protein